MTMSMGMPEMGGAISSVKKMLDENGSSAEKPDSPSDENGKKTDIQPRDHSYVIPDEDISGE